ncbi:MAG: electron transfer flavoprotein subunit alpha/FixB family protein [Conexivisphaerales archaeon]
MSSYSSILTYSEDEEIGLELITAAKEISKVFSHQIIAVTINTDPSILATSGCDIVCSVSVGTDPYVSPETAAVVLEQLSKKYNTKMLLIGSTKDGKELAGRLSGMLQIPAATDCYKLYPEDGELRVERMAFGGRVVATASLPKDSYLIALKARSYKKMNEQNKGKIEHIELPLKEQSVKVVNISKQAVSALDLTKAEKIVSVGRGLRRKEDLSVIEPLANVLGAAIGCSRPLAADLGWMPEEAHIGLSGIQVKPKLYMAIGISGQLQHMAGVKDAGIIVAINQDKSAPIFSDCDYGIVGDLYQIIPELTKQIEAIKKQSL